MEVGGIIAENLKRLRAERNLSLGRLAELSGVSKVMLSQIEKGDSNPTVNTIWKIAGGLQIPYTALLNRKEQGARVVKKAELDVQPAEEGRWRMFCYYMNTAERNFELFQIELDEGAVHTSVGHSQRSQEYVLVLEGQLALEVGGETFTLQADDAIAFAAEGKHTYSNAGKGTLRAMSLNFYPV